MNSQTQNKHKCPALHFLPAEQENIIFKYTQNYTSNLGKEASK